LRNRKKDVRNNSDPIPKHKTELTTTGPFSSDNIGTEFTIYPRGLLMKEKKKELFKEHENLPKRIVVVR